MESDSAANGIVSITYPSGGSSSSVERLVLYEDISASGGEKKKIPNFILFYCALITCRVGLYQYDAC